MIEQIVIDGHWLDLMCPWGDLSYTTVWPGGSGTASWTAHQPPDRLMRANLPVQIRAGMVPIWAGTLDEPNRDTGQMSATGLWSKADDWYAFDGSGTASRIPDVAIQQAIVDGLPWTWPSGWSVFASEVDVDLTNGPVTITQLMQSYADANSLRWSVGPDGAPVAGPDATVPVFHMWPDGNMASDSTNVATVLKGRYYSGTAYLTTTATNAEAVSAGYVIQAAVDLTNRGAMDVATATAILQTALDQGRSQPRWASTLVANPGDITNSGGVPVPLHTVQADTVVRLHGLLDDVNLLRGNSYIDVLLGQTSLANGQLTMTPMDAPANDLVSLLAEVPA